MKLGNITQRIMTFGQNFLIGDSLSWELLIERPGIVEEESNDGKLLVKKRMRFETHTRAWIKSIVWRLMGIVILGAISFAITRSWREMSLITILFHSIRVVLYYLHERVWERIHWGRIKHPLSVLPVRKALSPEDLSIVRNQLEKMGYLD